MSKKFTAWLLLPALFIDGLQAGITFGLIAIPGVGEIMSPAIDVSLSLSMGAGLITLMAFNGVLYWQYLGPGFIAEATPFFDNGPFWTAIVLASLLKKRSEEGGLVGVAAGFAASAVAPQAGIQDSLKNAASATSIFSGSQAPLQEPGSTKGSQPLEQRRNPALQLSKNMAADIKPAQKPTPSSENERTPRAANDNLRDIDGRGRTAYAA